MAEKGKAPPLEWSNESAENSDNKRQPQNKQSKAQVPLFPKKGGNQPKAVNEDALNDSNALEALFTAPELKNTKSFKAIIEQNREMMGTKDPGYKKAEEKLLSLQNPALSHIARTAVYVQDAIVNAGKTSTPFTSGFKETPSAFQQSKFLGTPASSASSSSVNSTTTMAGRDDKLNHNSKFFKLSSPVQS